MPSMPKVKRFLKQSLPRSIVDAIKVYRYSNAISKVRLDMGIPGFEVIEKLVDSGNTVVDIGANMGLYTKLLSDLVGPDGYVFSIEPLPSNIRVLSSVVRKASLHRVSLLNCALSDSDREALMAIPKWPDGEDNVYEAHVVETSHSAGNSVGVRCMKLDTLLNGLSPTSLDFVKCDVEGHEFSVLTGGMEWIQQWHPSILVELSGNPDDPGSPVQKVFTMLKGLGYGPFTHNANQLVHAPVPVRHSGKTLDYFFLTSSHVERLKQRNFSIR